MQTMSAPVTASSTDLQGVMEIPWRLDSRSAKFFARSNVLLATRIRLRVRTTSIASRCVRASTPEPTSARSDASGFARRRVARPLTAAVRTDVIEVASMIASSRPRPVSKRSTAPWCESRSVPSLRGKNVTAFKPSAARPPRCAGIRPSAPRFSAIQRIWRTGMSASPRASEAKARAMTSTHSFIGRSRGTSA